MWHINYSVVIVFADLADVMLGVELGAELGDQIKLGLEKIDVMLFVAHQLLEQVARDVILDRVAMGGGLLVERARVHLGAQIAFEDLFHRLPDMQRIEHLHVGEAVEKDDAVDELVGVLHLLDGLLAPLLGEIAIAPIVQQPVMQPILVDRGKFMPQGLVEIIDDDRLTAHGSVSCNQWLTRHGMCAAVLHYNDYNLCDECAKPPRQSRIRLKSVEKPKK